MTTPLNSNLGQPNLGLGQTRAETGLGAEAGLDNRSRQPGAKREEAGEMVMAAAFAMQLAGARATATSGLAGEDDDVVVVAAPPPPPLAMVLAAIAPAEADPATRAAELATLTETLRAEVQAADRIRLGSSPLTVTVPLNAPALGLTEARLLVSRGEVTVVFPLPAGADKAVVNGALAELAQALMQRFPTRTIRLKGEEDVADRVDPAEFNPFKEPVGRRK
jgi:hypothetical protein